MTVKIIPCPAGTSLPPSIMEVPPPPPGAKTTAISFNILLVLQTPLSQKHTFSGLKLHLHTYTNTINAVSLYYLWYGAIYTRQYTDQNTYVEKNLYNYASELRKCSHFHILKLLFLSIFCWYFQITLSVQMTCLLGPVGSHVPTKFPNVPTKLRKSIIGGGGTPSPPPPLATLVMVNLGHLSIFILWRT